jgi:tricorn protease-like protein
MFSSFNPAFDPSGDYLYFLSNREFAPQISGADFNYGNKPIDDGYALALRKDVKKSVFHPNPMKFLSRRRQRRRETTA